MADPFIGEIRMLPYNFVPRNWALCDGRHFQTYQFTSLFSIIGAIYGGDGRNTFALPNLQGRAPIHAGGSQGPGLARQQVGKISGSPQVTLYEEHIPAHTHQLQVINKDATADKPIENTSYPAKDKGKEGFAMYANAEAHPEQMATMAGTALKSAGGQVDSPSAPHENRQPYIVMPFYIALDGVFPSRN